MCVCVCVIFCMGLTGGSVVKNLPANAGDAGDMGLSPGSGRSPGAQYSSLENPMDRGALACYTVHGGGKELDTTK